jgi:hypothetical protein
MCVSNLTALQWSSTRLELKAVAGDREVSGDVTVTNASCASVQILELRPSCDCTSAIASTSSIPSGASATIHVSFRPGERLGEQEKSVRVLTSESPEAPTELLVHIRVAPVVSGQPRLLSWSVGDPVSEKIIELAGLDGFILRAISLPSPIAHFVARLEADPATHHFRLHLTPQDTSVPVTTNIRLLADVADRPPLPLTVYALVQSR